MNDELNAAVKTAASAVTGSETPDQVAATSKPDRLLVVAMAGAGPALCGLLAWVVWLIADRRWPAGVAPTQVDALKWVALAICLCLIVTVLRLASGQFKRADVKAGPASVSIGSD